MKYGRGRIKEVREEGVLEGIYDVKLEDLLLGYFLWKGLRYILLIKDIRNVSEKVVFILLRSFL